MVDYDDLPFKVDRWSKGYGRPEETIAIAADLPKRRDIGNTAKLLKRLAAEERIPSNHPFLKIEV